MAEMTAEALRRALDYCPETGVFTWREPASNRVKAGDRAGCLCKISGYRLIGIGGRVRKASRLAWLWMTGNWPPGEIDHENTDRADDRWENLRPATRAQQQANRGKQKNNSSGFKGVHYHPQTGKWRARIGIGRRHKCLGLHSSPEAAHAAYAKAATAVHGDFARAT